jgi:DNA adenine methylase
MQSSFLIKTNLKSKPFLKWAGGKTQLIPNIDGLIEKYILSGEIENYIEPFIGGGAIFFHLSSKYNLKNSIIADVNKDLILAYKTIKIYSSKLIEAMSQLENDFLSLDISEREKMYYKIRETYNKNLINFNYLSKSEKWIERSSYLIFLNRTCFNGLFRVNSKGEFNVPFGRYKNPTICNEENLRNISLLLKNTTIINSDFESLEKFVNEKSFVYFDPPYRPISKTASFNAYAKSGFNDSDQLRLASFFKKLDNKNAKLMLSNSDPKNVDENDVFFDEAFEGFNINRIFAKRNINSNANKRGKISELLITNF